VHQWIWRVSAGDLTFVILFLNTPHRVWANQHCNSQAKSGMFLKNNAVTCLPSLTFELVMMKCCGEIRAYRLGRNAAQIYQEIGSAVR
jgi:hypothetical protein